MENTAKPVVLSPEVQQVLGKLNVRMMDLMDQVNIAINVLVNENVELREKLCQLQIQQSKEEEVKK